MKEYKGIVLLFALIMIAGLRVGFEVIAEEGGNEFTGEQVVEEGKIYVNKMKKLEEEAEKEVAELSKEEVKEMYWYLRGKESTTEEEEVLLEVLVSKYAEIEERELNEMLAGGLKNLRSAVMGVVIFVLTVIIVNKGLTKLEEKGDSKYA